MAGVKRGRKNPNNTDTQKNERKTKRRKICKGENNTTVTSLKKTRKPNGVTKRNGAVKNKKTRAKTKATITKRFSKNTNGTSQVTNGTLSNGKASSSSSIPSPRKPPKFSWIVPHLLAGQGRPTQHGHVQYLVENGFGYIITLTLNKPRALNEFPGDGLTWIHIPVQDETPPTISQIQQFCDAVEKADKESVAVSAHCAWGRGRTGTMMACYLATSLCLTADQAITKIRELRPGSIDTKQQAEAVREWVNHTNENN